MTLTAKYPIGRVGEKWDREDKQIWLAQQRVQRSYQQQVVGELAKVGEQFELVEYGRLPYAGNDYPLFVLKTKNWQAGRPNVLVTGGVHGYETSGVHGAIGFAINHGDDYLGQFNFIIAPCVSPWGYETINRWNPDAVDPNRSFYPDSPSPEAALLSSYIGELGIEFIAHIDLHETTDSDNSEFRPALAARDAIEQKSWNIPDGFYLVGDTLKPADAWQKAIIAKVNSVTHIAPADHNNQLIGEPLSQFGVINYAARELGLCMGLTDAPYVTTTEVYPDSPSVDEQNCIAAQIAAVCGALEFLQDKIGS